MNHIEHCHIPLYLIVFAAIVYLVSFIPFPFYIISALLFGVYLGV